ncbi:uncharacterized protein BDZ99DRAFT_558063 [Mytilinidion resinicola]|uniref:Uncharacterized protein n=1 Tax=Mytilinidion resinicola TaxID=574789 RepID=A0A6A6YV08_9PEZI|nr:uncharacterized protein BDZ99DRAFT_558063 [Mytilinidion resinicola]KAF2812213.1 hypothetical protein BDZ99DRAFT_558063 [Mytilinidion resinicola]
MLHAQDLIDYSDDELQQTDLPTNGGAATGDKKVVRTAAEGPPVLGERLRIGPVYCIQKMAGLVGEKDNEVEHKRLDRFGDWLEDECSKRRIASLHMANVLSLQLILR